MRLPTEKDCSLTQTEKPCAGVVVYDEDGNFVERYACEVHLLKPGPTICAWQQAVYDERRAKR